MAKSLLHDGDLFEHEGFDFKVYILEDDCMDAPWENSDGHGPVSDWTTRDKLPGELILNSDRKSHRYYDFAEACRIARRDGWGFMPHKMEIIPVEGDFPKFAKRGGTVKAGPFTAFDPEDFNMAIQDVYRQHRETMTPRQYAAAAAMRDYEFLRSWCNDEWHYVGVKVEHVNFDDGDSDNAETESLWGIESDCYEYIDEVARELAGEIAGRLKARKGQENIAA